MMLMTDIHVRSFSGAGIKPYIHSIAKLRCEVLRDYPYFEEPDLPGTTQYLKTISSCKEALAVLIFDNTTLVGVSLGYPCALEQSELHRLLKEKELPLQAFYFFGESVLLKPYRGRGIGHHFFDAREAHVAHLPTFKHILFCTPSQIESTTGRPSDFVPLHDFWRKRGYVHHPEMHILLPRKRMGEELPQELSLTCWIKDLR